MTEFDSLLPYFPEEVQNLILDQTISDLMFCSGLVFVEREGKIEEAELSFPMDGFDLNSAIERVARKLGQDIDEQNPVLDTRLPDRSRVAAVFAPVAVGGSSLTIRKFVRHFSLQELMDEGCVPKNGILSFIIGSRRNLLISGGTGAGKTSLLNACVGEIDHAERLIVIEKPAEMKIYHRCVCRWEAVDELPGRPAITAAHLIKAALRHRPDRIILGEVRDASAYDLLQAMNTGHTGSMSTVHADNAVNALYRISGLATSAFPNIEQNFMRQETARAIHYVAHIERENSTGRRRITEIIRVVGYNGNSGEFETEEVYKENQNGG